MRRKRRKTLWSSSQATISLTVYHILRQCFTISLFITELQAGKLWILLLIDFDMTQLKIKPESAPSKQIHYPLDRWSAQTFLAIDSFPSWLACAFVSVNWTVIFTLSPIQARLWFTFFYINVTQLALSTETAQQQITQVQISLLIDSIKQTNKQTKKQTK